VASVAGVSVATISRVINGKGPVRDATRSRVLAAIEAMGYVPHSAARSLSTQRTMSFGVLLPEVHGEFFSELIRGIDLAARRSGYHLLVSCSHSDPAEAQAVLHALHGRVDGLIVMAPGDGRVSQPTRFPAGVPLVELSSRSPARHNDSIRIDNRGGARAATEHLIELGHRRLAMICGPGENSDARERQLGFEEALADHGLPLDPQLLLPGDFRELSGFRAGTALGELRDRPTAVFAANDAMAVGCLSALRGSGLAIPEDVALAGFDDIPIARYLTPGLTSVRVAIAELGARATERLLAAIEGGPASPRHHEIVPATLVVRGSTSNPRTRFVEPILREGRT
jgi:LacI family transcriptional regulator